MAAGPLDGRWLYFFLFFFFFFFIFSSSVVPDACLQEPIGESFLVSLAHLVKCISVFGLLVSFISFDELLHESKQCLQLVNQCGLDDGLIVHLHLEALHDLVLLATSPAEHSLQILDVLDHLLIFFQACFVLCLLLLDVLQALLGHQELVLQHVVVLLEHGDVLEHDCILFCL